MVCVTRESMEIIRWSYTYTYCSIIIADNDLTCNVGDLLRKIKNLGKKINHLFGRLFENVLSIKNKITFTIRPRAFDYPPPTSATAFSQRQVQPLIRYDGNDKTLRGLRRKRCMCTSTTNFASMKTINIIIHAYTYTYAFEKIFLFFFEFTLTQIDKYYYYFGLTTMQNATPRIYPYRYTSCVICMRISCL